MSLTGHYFCRRFGLLFQPPAEYDLDAMLGPESFLMRAEPRAERPPRIELARLEALMSAGTHRARGEPGLMRNMRIGARTLSQVHFVTPVHVGLNIPNRNEAGLLPTILFKRVYVNHADHFAVIEPW
jgi:hypothetical protein